jgi:rhodanese-related sulfurtransferase
MKIALLQLAAIVLLVLLAGTAYNLVNKGNPQKYLDWVSKGLNPGIDPPPQRGQKQPPNAPTPGQGVTETPKEAPKEYGTKTLDQEPTELEGFPLIPLEETLEEYHGGAALFVDARRTRDYEAGHITGAISICSWESDWEEKIGRLTQSGDVNLEAPIVVYCVNWKNCDDSVRTADNLKRAGFMNIKIYRGGFPEWQKKEPGLVTTGKEPGKKQ